MLTSPIVVFVDWEVLSPFFFETTRRLPQRLVNQTLAYMSSIPSPTRTPTSLAHSGLPPMTYFRMGWSEFMGALAQRVVEEHRAAIEHACESLIRDLEIESEDVAGLCSRLSEVGLPGLGQLRAA